MIHSIKSGNGGNPIIFIHGSSQSLNIWDKTVEQDALKSYQAITFDLPGHGESSPCSNPEKDYTLPGLGRQVAAFINELNLPSYIVVANSIGTNIVAEAMPELPNCSGVLFTGCSIIDDELTPADIMLDNPDSGAVFTAEPTDEQLEAYLDTLLFDQRNLNARTLYREAFLKTDKRYRQYLAGSISKNIWGTEIKNLIDRDILVALIYGAAETLVNKQYLKNVSLNKWRSEILEISHAGHDVPTARPSELATLIHQFAKDCFK